MRRLNMRWLRWSITRCLVAFAPWLGRRLSFPVTAVRPQDCARHVLEDDVSVESFASLDVDDRNILQCAMANDTGDFSLNPFGQCVFYSQAIVLDSCSVAGHSRAVVRDRDQALVHLHGKIGSINLAQPALLRERRAKGRAVVLSGTRHYYHFLANDVLPLISYVRRFHDPAEKLTLVAHADQTPAQREVFGALRGGWPFLEVLPLGRDERLSGMDLVWVLRLGANHEWMPVDRALADELGAMLVAHHGLPDASTGARRLWFSRGDVRMRALMDAREMDSCLAQSGFSRFVAHHENQRAQVEAFRSADVIVAVHGAGLANLLFCRPGTLVVEIFPSDFVKSTYLWLARRLGLRYRAHVGGPGDYHQRFRADVSAVQRLLAQEL